MARRRGAGRRSGGFQITIGAVSALAGVIVLVVWLSLSGRGGGSAAIDDVTAEGVRAGVGPAAAAGQFFKRIGDAWNATARIEALERENLQLRQWKDTSLALAERMERYEALLRIAPDAYGVGIRPENAISARLILDPGGPFKRTLLANAGADHGVQRGYIAINEHGLVGRVVTVGRRSSRVLLMDDYNSRVPVMGLQSRARAMLSGDASVAPTLETGQVALRAPRLDHQVPAGALREGERIVTSGDGGVFPRGLLVGVAERDGDGAWRVRLAAAGHPIDFVRIAPFAPVEAPELAPVAGDGPPLPSLNAPAAAPAIVALTDPLAQPKRRRVLQAPPTPPPPGSAGDDAAPPAPDTTPPAPPSTAPTGPPQ